MQASDLMTSSVLTVTLDTPVRRIAELLLEHGISAVPVVEDDGSAVGIISETDLVARSGGQGPSRQSWCVRLLAGRAEAAGDFLRGVDAARTARDVMSAPLVTVAEHAEVGEIVRLLTQHRIKRLPVVRGGRIVGIVSRADLLRALAGAEPSAEAVHPRSRLAETFARLDKVFHGDGGTATPAQPSSPVTPPEPVISAKDFRLSVTHFKEREARARAEQRHLAAERHAHDVEVVLGTHISEDMWRHILLGARRAAENGETEYQALRVPREACSDNGRAINVAESDWPSTLRGEAAELWLRWRRELSPRGFHLSARTLEYPDGIPGDIGLFLSWG